MNSDAEPEAPQREDGGPPATEAGAATTIATRDMASEADKTSATVDKDAEMHDAADLSADGAVAGNSDDLSAPPTNGSTSESANKEHNDEQADVAATYGTRSRNRPRGSRVNYAEDSGDIDFEVHPSVEGPTGQNRAGEREPTSSPNTSARQSPGVASKKGGGAVSVNASASQATIPGTSSFSANPNVNATVPTSKKRKAATSSHASNASGNAAVNGGTAGASRRVVSYPHLPPSGRESKIYTFDKCSRKLKNGKLVADDGTVFAVDDSVYMVCEPPGEPYYLGRIMEFRHTDIDNTGSPVDSMRINWFYRPRDIMRSSQDTRLLYATMHSDISPITSLRGKPTIRHRDDIEDGKNGYEKTTLDEYRKQKDHFWFDEVFDRFIHRYYKVVPVRRVVNVPEKVKQALNDRWKFIVVEHNKVKEMTQEGKDCKRCHNFAAPDDSVECAVCKNMYHMQCVRPPLLKKPSRGFGWSCAPCSRAQERRLEARHTPLMGDTTEAEDEELPEEEDPDSGVANTTAPSPNGSSAEVDLHPGTQAEIRLARMWPMRYLGIHCRPEDALLYDDRAIYPRASSRLGPRHQANVTVWHGRPVELVKSAEIRKRFAKNATHKKDGKFTKETVAAMEADREARAKRPKWVQDEPLGYVARGDDHPNASKENTAKLQFTMPTFGEHSSRGLDDAPASTPDEELVDEYVRRAKAIAKNKDIHEGSVDFLDAAVRLLHENDFDSEAALRGVRNLDPKKDLRDPMRVFNNEEKKRFDEGVAKYGSELRNVRLHCKSVKPGDTVRYWYMWKKTEKGREIWGSYGGRKGLAKKLDTDKLLDDIADAGDDSAFDSVKAKRGFNCKFCNTKKSRQWRRAPGAAPGSMVTADGKPAAKEKANTYYIGLCDRCASFWRRYAIKWEDYEDVAKRIAQGGTKQMRRRIDEEVLQEFRSAAEAPASNTDTGDAGYGTPTGGAEPVKKKQKFGEKELPAPVPAKEKQKPAPPPKLPTPPPPPIIPAEPRFRDLPCAICEAVTEAGDPAVAMCSSCRLTVHRNCYGVTDQRGAKWICDTCTNDRKETVSYDYKCVLCPIEERILPLVEPPKVSHKKKSERDKERERLERELCQNLERSYQQDQLAKGRPPMPREALKRTAANNWVHLLCAVWTQETKFGDTRRLDLVEGIPQIPTQKYEQKCKGCKVSGDVPCVSCHQCHATWHVMCARDAHCQMGFDITPVKGSRRDSTNFVTFGNEAGQAVAALWCPSCKPKTIVHPPNEIVDEEGTYALQRYVATFKQADLTLTGTTRKANLLDESAKTSSMVAPAVQANNRRASTTVTVATNGRGARTSNAGIDAMELRQSPPALHASNKRCDACDIDTAPRWFPVKEMSAPTAEGINGVNGVNSDHARDTPMVNGITDGAVSVPTERFHCQKCHWKVANNKPLPERPTKRESEQVQTRSPARPPAPLPDPWGSHAPRGLSLQQPTSWSHPPHIASSVAVPPQQSAPQGPPPALFHGGPLPAQHQPPPPATHSMGFGSGSAYRNPQPPPPPMDFSRISQPLPNGLPSPRHGVSQRSPTHPPPFGGPRDGPATFGSILSRPAGPGFMGGAIAQHNSPPSAHARPATPREPSFTNSGPPNSQPQNPAPPGRDPSAPPPGSSGAPGGASASPSLRNLLH